MTRSTDLYHLAEDLFLRHEYRASYLLYQAGDELAIGEANERAESTCIERERRDTEAP